MKKLIVLGIAATFGVWHDTSQAVEVDVEETVFETFISTGLSGSTATAIRHAGDGSGRLFIARQNGQIRIVESDGTLLSSPFLSLSSSTQPLGFSSSGERGLLGLAFHPLYASNGRFFVHYSDGSGNTVISEFSVSASNPNLADPNSEQVIFRAYQPYSNHNGGDITFGPDGYLYIALGDGGSGNDPCNSGQSVDISTLTGCSPSAAFLATPPAGVPAGNTNSRALLGKILRIDIDATSIPLNADVCADATIRRYGIPADNPFAGNAGPSSSACDEIYHYGLRNPWRFSFDKDTHDLIIADVGQNAWEEVNLVPGTASGLNFGWKPCEGRHAMGSTSTLCTLAGRTDPILTYGRSVGYSITGGYRYRGPSPALQGLMYFADYGGKIFAAQENAGTWSLIKTWTGVASPTTFGEDEDGNLYFNNSSNGRIFKITGPVPVWVPDIFKDGFEAKAR